MTMRVFKAAVADSTAQPIVFSVEGDTTPFTVARPVPAMPLLEMAAEAASDQAGSEQAALAAFHRFLQAVLGDQWPRFRDAATRARWGTLQVLEVVQFIVEEAAGRPTTPPPDAPPTSPATGQPSQAEHYWMAAHTPPN